MPARGEYKTVQARIVAYGQEIGWTYDPAAGTGRQCPRMRAVKVDIDGGALIGEVVAARFQQRISNPKHQIPNKFQTKTPMTETSRVKY